MADTALLQGHSTGHTAQGATPPAKKPLGLLNEIKGGSTGGITPPMPTHMHTRATGGVVGQPSTHMPQGGMVQGLLQGMLSPQNLIMAALAVFIVMYLMRRT